MRPIILASGSPRRRELLALTGLAYEVRPAAAPEVPLPDHDTLLQRQIAFGYTFEDQRIVIAPMARDWV